MDDIQKFGDETKDLRRFIEHENVKQIGISHNTEQIKAVLDRIDDVSFEFNAYDNVVVRHLVTGVKLMEKKQSL